MLTPHRLRRLSTLYRTTYLRPVLRLVYGSAKPSLACIGFISLAAAIHRRTMPRSNGSCPPHCTVIAEHCHCRSGSALVLILYFRFVRRVRSPLCAAVVTVVGALVLTVWCVRFKSTSLEHRPLVSTSDCQTDLSDSTDDFGAQSDRNVEMTSQLL